ncbi:MAG: DUF5063 domain-containing protein [Porphyromonas sp.]|nr:DUF5063 domain-containing protein [Porphyromonas sp.]
MSEVERNSLLQQPSVLTFIQHAAGYSALMEQESTLEWDYSALERCQKTLAYVYAAACDLPELTVAPFYNLDRLVREEDYERVRQRMSRVFGEHDYFLNAQMEEMKYSDVPVSVSTSELLADLYQILADTVWAFRTGVEQNMYQAIAEVKYTFAHEWGSLLLAVLRQIHDLKVSPDFFLDNEYDAL